MAQSPKPKSSETPRPVEDARDSIARNVLPIPDVTPVSLTTFDAKDPETRYPPIRQLRPPSAAPNVLSCG
jgi:hypothetical protein